VERQLDVRTAGADGGDDGLPADRQRDRRLYTP
jgi:hypothetical protein